MDDIGIENWIDQVEANKAARAEKRTVRNKTRKIVIKKGVFSQNSQQRLSTPEGNTGRTASSESQGDIEGSTRPDGTSLMMKNNSQMKPTV